MTLDRKVQQDPQGLTALMEQQVRKVLPVRREFKVTPVQQVLPDLKARQVPQELMVSMVRLDRKVRQVPQVRME